MALDPRRAWLSLGSNLGDREAKIREALRRLDSSEGVKVTAVSPIYETEPWGKEDQPRFLNAAAEVVTTLPPTGLLSLTQRIEAALGRVRGEVWGARTIDIDILVFQGVEMTSPGLTLPHPYIVRRAFALIPLADIAGDLMVGGESIAHLAKEIGSDGVVPYKE